MAQASKKVYDIILDRVPPTSNEAEMAVLGSMLIEKEAIESAISLLKRDDFYRESHRLVWDAITGLYEENKEVDVITVVERLRSRGAGEQAGGPIYITELVNSVLSAANVGHYARIVVDKADDRRMITFLTESIRGIYEQDGDREDFRARLESKFMGLLANRDGGKEPVASRDVVPAALEMLEKINSGEKKGIPSGFVDLDNITGGWQDGDMVVLGARPSVGKTSMSLHFIINSPVPSLMFSVEMPKEQIGLRMIRMVARVDSQDIHKKGLKEAELDKIAQASAKLAAKKFWIDDTSSIGIPEIRNKIRHAVLQNGIKLVVIDYLQLLRVGSGENRNEKVGELCRGIKGMALEFNIPIIVTSQLSRAVESRSDKTPMLSDYRDSGSIEQDADIVFGLMRPEMYNKTDRQGVGILTVLKHRNGPTGVVELAYMDKYASFGNIAKGT